MHGGYSGSMRVATNITRLVKYFRENLGAPFVILSLLLLIVGKILIIYTQSLFGIELARRTYHPLLNGVGVCAFFSLALGVILQLISFRRARRKLV